VQSTTGSSDRRINMPYRAIPQSPGVFIILFLGDIASGLSQKIKGFVESTHVIGPLIYRWMPADVLAVINCCLFDVVDRTVDLAHSIDFVLHTRPIPWTMLDHPTCGT